MSKDARKSLADLLAVMAALQDARHRLPVGPGADLQDASRPTPSRKPTRSPTPSRRATWRALKEELGDLLLQVVYHARMAEEEGAFAFADVVDAITAKMIRRHPHVFGTRPSAPPARRPGFWERIKAEERAAGSQRSASPRREGLDTADACARDVWPTCRSPPGPHSRRQVAGQSRQGGLRLALARAGVRQAQGGAGRAGAVVATRRARGSPIAAKIEEEFGDLLFVVANVARHLKIDPEAALRAANQKFIRRFRRIEELLAADGRTPAQSTLAEMDRLGTRPRPRSAERGRPRAGEGQTPRPERS